MNLLRPLATAALTVNASVMAVSALTPHDWKTFTFAYLGAGLSGYARILFIEEEHAMGQHKQGYRDLAIALRYEIQQHWVPGARLPSYRQLAEQFGTTRQTVNRAMRILADDNIVEIIHGRGTYVLGDHATPRAGKFEQIENYIRHIAGQGRDARSEAIAQEVGASPSTVRRVMRQLVIQGFLRRRSDGNYVRS